MTKDKEIRDDVIELMGTTLLHSALYVWFAKRGVYHLTGRDPGWRGAYAILAAAQAVGYWHYSGRDQFESFKNKAETLKVRVEAAKARGKK